MRHFNNTPADTENTRAVGLRVRASLFPSEEQTPQREIVPFAALEKATTTSTREKPQASEILNDAGLRIVLSLLYLLVFLPLPLSDRQIFLSFERKVMNK